MHSRLTLPSDIGRLIQWLIRTDTSAVKVVIIHAFGCSFYIFNDCVF